MEIERSTDCWSIKIVCNIAHRASYTIILMVQQNY